MNTNEYRANVADKYALRPDDLRTNEKCPLCGCFGTYRRYIHIDTKELLPQSVGKCNRREACGYSFTAKQHFIMENKRMRPAPPTDFIKEIITVDED